MRKRRVRVTVMLAVISLSLMIQLPISLARTRSSGIKKTADVPAQPLPQWDMEIAALRQQLEEQRQVLDTLRGQLAERQGVAEALTARLEERRAAEDVVSGQLEQLRQDVQQQRHLLYGALWAMIVSLGLLFSLRGWFPNYRTRNRRILRIPHNWATLK